MGRVIVIVIVVILRVHDEREDPDDDRPAEDTDIEFPALCPQLPRLRLGKPIAFLLLLLLLKEDTGSLATSGDDKAGK